MDGPVRTCIWEGRGSILIWYPVELMADCRSEHKRPHRSISTDPGVHGMIYYEAGRGGPERAPIGRLHGMSAMSYSNSTFLWRALSRDLAYSCPSIPYKRDESASTSSRFCLEGNVVCGEVTFLGGMPSAQPSAKVVGYLRTPRGFWLLGNQPASATNLHIAYISFSPFVRIWILVFLSIQIFLSGCA
jgi:hypothetical protein